MNRFTKKQLLIGGLVLLIVINLAALGTFLYQNYQEERGYPPPPETRKYEKDRFQNNCEEKKDRFSEFIKRKLDLTEDQYSRFKKLRQESRKEQIQIRRQISSKTGQMMNELSSLNPDRKKLTRINQDIGELHMELNSLTIEYFTKMKNHLETDQKKKLNQLMEKMSEHRERHHEHRHKIHK